MKMDILSSENDDKNRKRIKNYKDIAETVDPDYVSVLPEKLQSNESLSEQQQDAKENAIQKIKNIVRQQFALELHLKEQEIKTINQRIRHTKAALDRLRACVLARYYGMSQALPDDNSSMSFSRTSCKKLRRSRRESTNYHSVLKTVKTPRSIQLNNTLILSTSAGFSNARDTGHSNPVVTTSLLNTNTSLPGHKDSLNFSLDKHRTLDCAASNFVKTEKSTSLNKLRIAGGETERSLSVAKLPNEMSASRSSSQSGSLVECKLNPTLLGFVMGDTTKANVDKIGKGNLSGVNPIKGQSTVASESHLLDGGQIGSGSQLNMSGTQSNASLQTGSPLVYTQAKTMESQPGALSLQGSLKNGQGNQLSFLSNMKGIHIDALKDTPAQSTACGSGSRFYVKKRIIVGNTSKYIAPEKREENDKSTHKWMVYVRGPPEDSHIDVYIQKVWFFLHPSYRPNDIIEINKPPFQLTRRGWGEFPIRVQLHFVGARKKRVDIIHELKLDKTYTGLQTLGAETVVDLQIDRKTFDDLGIPVPFEVSQDTEGLSDAKSTSGTPLINLNVNDNENPGVSKLKRRYHSDITIASSSDAGELSTIAQKKPRMETPLSSVIPTPCGSPISSRCASPVLASKVNFLIENGLEDQLHNFAEKIPLIAPKRDVVNHPFSAPSAEVFLSWNVGKRRAAEWQRAAKICAQIAKQMENAKITTKGVMVWCRRFGYTPQENLVMASEVGYCKMCGKLIEQDTMRKSDPGVAPSCTCSKLSRKDLSSLTSLDEILKEIEKKESHLNEIASLRDSEEDSEVDVVGLSNSDKSKITTHNLTSVLSIPLTSQQQWVRDICNDIGIGLRPVKIQGIEINATESILLKVAMKFGEELLRKASSLSVKTDSALEPKIIVPTHIYQAIRALPWCDFLSNSYFGHASENQT